MLNCKAYGLYLVFFVLTACSSSGEIKPAHEKSNAPSTNKSQTLSSFCGSLGTKLYSADNNFTENHFDRQKFINNIFIGANSSSNNFISFKRGVIQSIDNITQGIINITSNNRWSLIKYKENGNTAKCMLRSDIANNGIMIIEFYLTKTSSKIKIFNWYDHIQNVLGSDLVRNIVVDYKNIDDSISLNLITKDSYIYKDFIKLATYLRSFKINNPENSLYLYKSLPIKYKNNPIYALRLFTLKADNNTELYKKTLATLHKQFKNNKKFDLIFFDYYVLTGQNRKALKAIENAEKRIGKDSGLSLMKALAYKASGNNKKFYAMCLEAINADMAYESTYWILLEELISKKHYNDAVLVLDIMTKVFSYSFTRERFETDPTYAGLSKSTVFDEWIDSF
jgi:hypothetical protein